VKLLLDTNALLWWASDPALLAEPARLAIANGRSRVYVSPISLVEIAIKEAIGKLKVPASIVEYVAASRFTELPLTIVHAAAIRELPSIHKDPFDRILIAQARVEALTLVCRDADLARYDVPLLAA